MSSHRGTLLLQASLPVVAISIFAVAQAAILASAGTTLGHDFLAYHAAAQRVLHGEPLYQFSFERAGGFGLFLYPPTFLPLILPFGLLDAATATWAWIGTSLAALLAGIWLLPVERRTRWTILLLAGLSWPVAYTIKLGQVTPILFLLVVVGWRALAGSDQRSAGDGVTLGDGGRHGPQGPRLHTTATARSIALGATAALGAAIKIQPGLLLAWAVLTRRWAAVAAGALVLLVLAALSVAIAGPIAWTDYVALVRQITDPVTTEHNVTPGTVAHGMGLPLEAATLLQLAVVVGALAAVVVSAWRASAVASYLVVVAASQLISPVLWDHYAMLLLVPVAWLLAHRHRWAVAIPLATSLPLIWITPIAAYPLAFAVTLAATLALGARGHGPRSPQVEPLAAA